MGSRLSDSLYFCTGWGGGGGGGELHQIFLLLVDWREACVCFVVIIFTVMTTVLVKQPVTFQSQVWRSNHRAVPTFSLSSFLSVQEQELAAKAKVGRTRTSSTSSATFNHWRDHDSDQGPPGSCGGGGGGLGGLDTSGARFVFWA